MAVIAAFAAGGGYVAMLQGLFHHDPPSVTVVADPKVGLSGLPVFALAAVETGDPIDYLRGGTDLVVDCYARVEAPGKRSNYLFVRLGPHAFDSGNWVDEKSLVLPNGTDPTARIMELPRCPD